MKRWLTEHFLPMWAKETVLRDNQRLARQVIQLRQEKEKLESCIKGIRMGQRRKHENI